MQFVLIVGIVVGVALLMRAADRVELPEKLPLYVGLVLVGLIGVWWLVGSGR